MFRTLFIGLGDFGEKVASYTYSEFYNEHSNLTNANALLTLNKELCTTFGDSEKKTITSLDFEENEYAKNLKYLKSKHEVSLALEDSFDFVSSIEFGMGAIADGVDVEVNEQRIIIYFSIGDSVSSVSWLFRSAPPVSCQTYAGPLERFLFSEPELPLRAVAGVTCLSSPG